MTDTQKAVNLAETLIRSIAPFDPQGQFAGINLEVRIISESLIYLHQVIESAPHGTQCPSRPGACRIPKRKKQPCNCWKKAVLAPKEPTM